MNIKLYEHTCQICGTKIEHSKQDWATKKLLIHIRKKHLLTREEYVTKHIYKNEIQYCACGCGEKVKLAKGLKYYKYFSNHKNFVEVSSETRLKLGEAGRKNLELKNGTHTDIDLEKLKKLWKEYKEKGAMSLSDIAEQLSIDRRTIKRILIYHGITTENEVKQLTSLSQISISAQKRSFEVKNQDILNEAIEIIQFNFINGTSISYSNLNLELGTNYSSYTWKNRLSSYAGSQILNQLKSGLASKEELDLLFILRHYFGSSNVESNITVEQQTYDYCVNNKILIEYDGEYWHKDKQEHDSYKEQLAKTRGYLFYRISRKTRSDIQHLLNIKKLLESI